MILFGVNHSFVLNLNTYLENGDTLHFQMDLLLEEEKVITFDPNPSGICVAMCLLQLLIQSKIPNIAYENTHTHTLSSDKMESVQRNAYMNVRKVSVVQTKVDVVIPIAKRYMK